MKSLHTYISEPTHVRLRCAQFHAAVSFFPSRPAVLAAATTFPLPGHREAAPRWWGISRSKVTQCIFLSAHLNVRRFKLVWPNWSCEAKIFLVLDILHMGSLSHRLINPVLYLMQNDPGYPVLWKRPQLAVMWCCIWHPFKRILCELWPQQYVLLMSMKWGFGNESTRWRKKQLLLVKY